LLPRAQQAAIGFLGRLRLPSASVLPVAGAIVGVYAGLAAGLFASLVGIMNGLALGVPHAVAHGMERQALWMSLELSLIQAHWHSEFAIVGVPLALAALWLSKKIPEGERAEIVRRRLRVLAVLTLLALGLYYPLVGLSAINAAFQDTYDLIEGFQRLPFWAVLFAPALGGLIVGRLLRDKPHVHGHGVPEVVAVMRDESKRLSARDGLLKLIASAVTIGSGGSAGREGPIVYGGAAFGSSVGYTLGFTREELSVLLACGAGAGIAASFNAPIAGAMFAVEIILRELKPKAFSPIILASVTATMVGRGVMGGAGMLNRNSSELVGGSEILAYVVLGLACGLLGFAFTQLLHFFEKFFQGRIEGGMSAWLGRRPFVIRPAIGGLICGALALISPVVWGTGHHWVNYAAVGSLSVWFLVLACALKLVATSVTMGSGGSGGTFFPAAVIGAMAGGALGTIVHGWFPEYTDQPGAYVMVGMAGSVSALTRGPLTGIFMAYELSGNYAIILPLMVTCTIASTLCHTLVERQQRRGLAEPAFNPTEL
jgi:CIC family chloride channel protein